jgi:hypothetical protein
MSLCEEVVVVCRRNRCVNREQARNRDTAISTRVTKQEAPSDF